MGKFSAQKLNTLKFIFYYYIMINKIVKLYKRLQSPTQSQAQGHVKNGPPIASLMLITRLISEHSTLIFLSLPTHCDLPCIKVKVIERSMSIYGIHKSTVMPSFNVIAYILSDILQVTK